jgi:hypothetical protein
LGIEVKREGSYSSRPITPPPITTSFLGTVLRERAPVDEIIVSSSIYISE